MLMNARSSNDVKYTSCLAYDKEALFVYLCLFTVLYKTSKYTVGLLFYLTALWF